MKKWKTLYKQTSAGKVQQWTVSVDGNRVIAEYGLTDGKKQTAVDVVKEGLNIGKSNATTPEEQAVLQAQQTYDSKLKKGYVLDAGQAAAKKNNLAAFEPMLAFPIEKKESHVVFPAFAQPKLDGLRCTAIIDGGTARLFSRTQKPIITVPHIVAELEMAYAGCDVLLDGELYNHDLRDDFNEITHIVKRDDVHPAHRTIEYHQYDAVVPGGYDKRSKALVNAGSLKVVRTVLVQSRQELEEFQAECLAQGYEGAMLRNPAGEYEHKRSPHLLKVKTFQDSEFKIVGAEEGSGKLMGALGAFVLITAKGAGFKAKPACSLAKSVELWRDRARYIGQMGTVKFQSLTPAGIPRFPVFKATRND